MKDKAMVPHGDPKEITPTGVWSPAAALHREMDRLFDDFTRGWGLAPSRFFEPRRWSELTPRVDVAETDKEIKVTAELPGMEEKDIRVTLAGGLLTLQGEKKAEAEEKGKNFHRLERTFGSFERAVELPAEVDPAKVEAAFKKGVLTVTLAKTPAARSASRKIEVKAG
jgi:HSP20 family protein